LAPESVSWQLWKLGFYLLSETRRQMPYSSWCLHFKELTFWDFIFTSQSLFLVNTLRKGGCWWEQKGNSPGRQCFLRQAL
jgi:hypothetical protein